MITSPRLERLLLPSFVVRGRSRLPSLVGVRERLVAVPMHCVAVSAVTQAELLYGVAKRGHPQGLATKVREFLARVPGGLTIDDWTKEPS